MLGTLDFTVSEHQDPFNFPKSTALFKCPLLQNEEPFQNKNLYNLLLIKLLNRCNAS